MRGLALSLILVAVAGDVVAQGLGAAADREKKRREALRAQEWQEFRGPAGDFKVSFPYPPMRKREAIPGAPTMMDTFVAVKNERSFVVRVGELPRASLDQETRAKMLGGVRETLLRESRGQIERERPLRIGAHEWNEIRIRTKPEGDIEMLLLGRVCIVPERIFLLLSAAKASDPDTATTEKFFASFEILR